MGDKTPIGAKAPTPAEAVKEATAPTVFAKRTPTDKFKEKTKLEPIQKTPEMTQEDKAKELNKKMLAAAEKGDVKAVWDLIDEGADVNARDSFNRTPLILAASGGHSETVELLLIKGADVNAADKAGTTALMQVAGYSYSSYLAVEKDPAHAIFNPVSLDKIINTIIPLLEKRADIGVVNELGHSPISHLKMLMNKDKRLAKVLQEGVWCNGNIARFVPVNGAPEQEIPDERNGGVD